MLQAFPAYIGTLAAILIIYGAYCLGLFKKYDLIGAYSIAVLFYMLSIYLTSLDFKNRPASTVVPFFTILPLPFIDKTWRIALSSMVFLTIHCVLSFIYKGVDLGSLDLLNCSIAFILGQLFGRMFYVMRLQSLETRRLLIIERNTDSLTGLGNRRNLFEYFEELKAKQHKRIGVFMLDIDAFKEYNDMYGHIEGTNVLNPLPLI